VDDYLETCRELGRQTEKPCNGSVNIRLTSELHQKLIKQAMTEGVTLNTYVKKILVKAVNENHA